MDGRIYAFRRISAYWQIIAFLDGQMGVESTVDSLQKVVIVEKPFIPYVPDHFIFEIRSCYDRISSDIMWKLQLGSTNVLPVLDCC